MKRMCVTWLFVAAALGQGTDPAARGSVSGVVYEASSGAPMQDVQVFVAQSGARRSTTNAQGRYTLSDLAPGGYLLVAGRPGATGRTQVTIGSGQKLDNVDIRILAAATIAGRVLDEEGEGLPGMQVFLIERSYGFGKIRYSQRFWARTNALGEYTLSRVPPGRGYLVLARQQGSIFQAISDAPSEPKLRRRAVMPMYFPTALFADAAEAITLLPGELRDNVDIHVKHAPAYCIEGRIAGASPGFWVQELEPSMLSLADESGMIGGFMPLLNGTAENGLFRRCDLHPGEYLFTAFNSFRQRPPVASIVHVVISDSDVHDLNFTPSPGPTVTGEVVWDQPIEGESARSTVKVELRSLALNIPGAFGRSEDAQVPGSFKMDHVLSDEYAVLVRNLPQGAYLKDITSGGLSILEKPLEVGPAGAELRLVLGSDGGRLATSVTDKEGIGLPQRTVVIIPARVASEADCAAKIVTGLTDQTGVFRTATLAPGQYVVLAIQSPMNYSPEMIRRIWQARTAGKTIDIGPKATAQVEIRPTME